MLIPIPPNYLRLKRSRPRRYSPHRAGKQFEAEISKSLKFCQEQFGDDFFWDRFHDTRDYVKINPLLQIPAQPSDYYAIYRGNMFFLEAKSSKTARTYKLEYVKPSQIELMTKARKAGAHSYILFCRRIPRENRVFAMPIDVFSALKEVKESEDKKSALWTEIRGMSTEIGCFQGKVWDLRPLFTARLAKPQVQK